MGCSVRAAWPAWASRNLTERIEVLRWDLGDADGLAGEGRDRIAAFAPDCIYHLAALSVPSDCGTDEPAPRAVAVNVDGTTRVLELAMSLSSPPRVLFTSTSHVFAPVAPAKLQVDERAPLGPWRGYGITKLAAEERIREVVRRAGLDVVIARSFQHTGPRQEPKLMLPEWAKQFARQGSEPVRVKNPNTWIDLSDVRDVVRAYRLLIELGEAGSVYNVGSGIARRTGEVLDILAKYADPSRMIEIESHDERHDPIADNRKLVACTHWQPEIPLEKTVRDTFDYWRERNGELE